MTDPNRVDDSTPVALVKLARTLQVPIERIAFLADVPAADLTSFRLQVADMLFESQSRRLTRVAAAARVLPAPVVAKLVQLKPNALLTAGAAGMLEPGHAVDIAKRLPTALLAQVAARLDSRRAEPIIGKLPTRTITQVAEQMARTADWVTLGDLVGLVSDDAAKAAIAALSAPALVQAARMVDDPASLARFTGLLSERTVTEMISVISEQDLWHELRPTLRALPAPARALATTAAEQLPADRRARALSEIAAATQTP